jgi:hypothetical protein
VNEHNHEKTVSGKESSKFGDSTSDLSFNNSIEGYNRMGAGIQFGAGFRFKVKQKDVVLDTRYTYGLLSISNGQEMINRYLNISLHFSKPWKTNPLGRN